MKTDPRALMAALGYSFQDDSLLVNAVTHTSFVKGDGRNTPHNERLAFVGDAVLELLVRARLVGTTRLQPNRLHTVATHYVSAHAQNLELDIIEPMLTDAEAAVLRRGKNASKATVAKHATVQEYRASTGFECLLGWLYLQGRNDRIEELFNAMWDGYKPE